MSSSHSSITLFGPRITVRAMRATESPVHSNGLAVPCIAIVGTSEGGNAGLYLDEAGARALTSDLADEMLRARWIETVGTATRPEGE